MRISLLLWMVVILPALAPAYAQVSVGVVAGVNVGTLHLDDPDVVSVSSQTMLSLGGVVGVPLGHGLGLQAEPTFVQKGGLSNERVLGIRAQNEFQLSYLEVPVLLTYSFAVQHVRPYLMAGPALSVLLDADDVVLHRPEEQLLADIDGIVKPFGFGLAAGGGVSYPVGRANVFVQGRYTLGLLDISKEGNVRVLDAEGTFLDEVVLNDDTTKTRDFQVMVGITVPLGR